MAIRFDQLSSAAFERICENLPDMRDIFNLQLTNSQVFDHVRCTFWGRPRRLRLADSSNATVFLDSGRCCSIPSTRAAIDVLTRRARHLNEFDFSSECARDENYMIDIIRVLKQNVSRITTLHLAYVNPSVMYVPARERDANKVEQRAYPTLKTHKRICELISRHSAHLQLLHIRMNDSGLVSIGRNRTGEELHVEFNCECDQNIRLLLHPVFTGYTALCRRRPRIFRLGLNVADVELNQLVFNFCTHHVFPNGSNLEEIHCRIQNPNFAALFDVEEMRPDLRASLSKIVWHIEDPNVTPINGVRTTICEVQLKAKLFSANLDESSDEFDAAEAADQLHDLPARRRLPTGRPRFGRSLRQLRCAS